MLFPLPRNRMNLSVAGLAYVLLTFWQRKDGDCKAFGRDYGRKHRDLAVKQWFFAFGTRFDHKYVSTAQYVGSRTESISHIWLI